jgi:hypothetical protein
MPVVRARVVGRVLAGARRSAGPGRDISRDKLELLEVPVRCHDGAAIVDCFPPETSLTPYAPSNLYSGSGPFTPASKSLNLLEVALLPVTRAGLFVRGSALLADNPAQTHTDRFVRAGGHCSSSRGSCEERVCITDTLRSTRFDRLRESESGQDRFLTRHLWLEGLRPR